nr:response regulator [Janthinobacterium lividum]
MVVLVVDDVEPMRKVIAAQLGYLGIDQLHMAPTGDAALNLLRTHDIDLVLSDWNMPGMSGMALLGAMREDPLLCSIPFIMITADAERHRIDEAIAQGVADLLVKPYTTARLAKSIERAMSAPPFRRPPALSGLTTHEMNNAQKSEPALDQHPEEKLTILLVDDQPDNLHVLYHIFKDRYRILAADSGKRALDMCCSDSPPDLVMLDVIMPGMDGFEVARCMRKHPSAENIPVIFVTALTDEKARIQGLGLGAVDFVTKPVDPQSVVLRVRNFMRYASLRRQLQGDCDRMLAMARLREAADDMMRNDIQGPLKTVLSVLQGLRTDKELLRRHSLQLENGEQAVLNLLDLVHLSSQLYKIESGRYVMEAEPVPIAELLRQVVTLARTGFKQRKLTIVVDSDGDVGVEPPRIAGDATLTFALLQNLLKNACEASPDHGRVSVALINVDPVRIVIVNKGVVPTQIRPYLFEKYTTVGKPGAAGLGAYSARLMAHAQGGSIELDVSDERNTTTLTIFLPKYTSQP